MKVFITLKGSALKIDIQASDDDGAKWLAEVIREIGKRPLSGKFVSYVEMEDKVNSATLILSAGEIDIAPEEEDLTPDVARPPKGLLN